VLLQAGNIRVEVAPQDGGRIAQIFYNDVELLIARPNKETTIATLTWGCYPMAPFAGRLADGTFAWNGNRYSTLQTHGKHAIHGTVVTRPWEVLDHSDTHVNMSISLDDGSHALWPFAGTCEHIVQVTPNEVKCVLTIHALEPFPYQLGWHPCWRKPDSAHFTFSSMFEKDIDQIPTGRMVEPTSGPWDDCFTDVITEPTLHINDVAISLTSTAEYWVIYDELAHSTCIEPQTGPPNAFNLFTDDFFDVAQPQQEACAEFTIRLGTSA